MKFKKGDVVIIKGSKGSAFYNSIGVVLSEKKNVHYDNCTAMTAVRTKINDNCGLWQGEPGDHTIQFRESWFLKKVDFKNGI